MTLIRFLFEMCQMRILYDRQVRVQVQVPVQLPVQEQELNPEEEKEEPPLNPRIL